MSGFLLFYLGEPRVFFFFLITMGTKKKKTDVRNATRDWACLPLQCTRQGESISWGGGFRTGLISMKCV